MKIRFTLMTALTAASVACTNPADNQDPMPAEQSSATAPTVMAAVAGSVSIGSVVTVSDPGWKASFGGTIQVETDATVIYAFVFGGTGSAAPVSGVRVGSQALVRVSSATGATGAAIDVYRATVAGTGSQGITVTRSKTAYDPVRVTVVTVRGANQAVPNGAIASLNITPSTATATKTVSIASSAGALTISAVYATPSYVNVTGVTATPGFQGVVSTGEDTDGAFGVVGSAPGAASVTHSWTLKADASGRSALLVSFSINAVTGATEPPPPPPPTEPPSLPSIPPVEGTATFGSVITIREPGSKASVPTTLNVEGDATVVYAVVFNGTGGKAPVTGVTIGGQAMTRIKSAERTLNASLDVFRLVGPPVGPQPVLLQRAKLGYDPVRVSVFTVRGANVTTPNGTITETDITPSTSTATRTVSIYSAADGLTISAVAASGMYANGNGVTATAGFQTTRAGGEDDDGIWGVLGSAPGAFSVVHSYDLKADASGRSAYVVSFTINGASGTPPPPPPPVVKPLPPPPSAGWTSVLDFDVSQLPARAYGSFENWTVYERPGQQMFYSNLTLIQDPTQPSGDPGAARVMFLPTLPGGYAPTTFQWVGAWPSNTGSLDLTFTIKLSANWDNNGVRNQNTTSKILFFGSEPQNNHFLGMTGIRYDGATPANPALGGAWLEIGLQNPTISYNTNVDLTRDVWHTVRVQMVGNTPGIRNGQLRVWVDGVQALLNTGKHDKPLYTERTDVMYFSSGQPARQNRLDFEPVYGGGYDSPPYTQWFDIGNVYAAVR